MSYFNTGRPRNTASLLLLWVRCMPDQLLPFSYRSRKFTAKDPLARLAFQKKKTCPQAAIIWWCADLICHTLPLWSILSWATLALRLRSFTQTSYDLAIFSSSYRWISQVLYFLISFCINANAKLGSLIAQLLDRLAHDEHSSHCSLLYRLQGILYYHTFMSATT